MILAGKLYAAVRDTGKNSHLETTGKCIGFPITKVNLIQ